MRRDKHSKKRGGSGNGNWRNNRRDYRDDKIIEPKKIFHSTIKAVSSEQIREDEVAIREFKSNNQPICPKCGNIVNDMSTAIFDQVSGMAAHFDCIVSELQKKEQLSQGDRIAYIGQGRFGILNYPNVHDNKHFTIKKIIELESKENKPAWRDEMAELFSRVR